MDILKYLADETSNIEYATSILNTLRLQKFAQKTNIAKAANIPWASAASLIDEMAKKNFVIDNSGENSNEKRKLLTVNPQVGYFIGVSVGTSHIKVAILDFNLNVVDKNYIKEKFKENQYEEDLLQQFGQNFSATHETKAQWCIATPSANESENSANLLEIKSILNYICDFSTKLNACELKVFSICFSFPGHIDFRNNIIVESSNFDFNFKNVGINNLFTSDILDKLHKQNTKIYLEHNVKAAAVAEIENIYDKNFSENMAIVYFGTGLGTSMILDSKLYRGSSNASGQIGHTHFITNVSSDICSCGRVGCLEQIIRNDVFSGIDIKTKTGEQLAKELLSRNDQRKKLVYYLSETIYNMVMLLEIDTIVFSGKLSEIYKVLENEIQEQMISNNISKLKIFPSPIGDYASSIGSAMCGYYRILDIPFKWNRTIANTKADI